MKKIIAAVDLRGPQKNERSHMAKNDSEVTVSPAAAQACTRAIQLLKPYADEPRVAALARKLAAIANPTSSVPGDLAGAMADVDSIKKSELDPAARERVRKSQRSLEAEYLAKYSPAAYATWEQEARRAGIG